VKCPPTLPPVSMVGHRGVPTGPLLYLTREGNHIPSLRRSLSLFLHLLMLHGDGLGIGLTGLVPESNGQVIHHAWSTMKVWDRAMRRTPLSQHPLSIRTHLHWCKGNTDFEPEMPVRLKLCKRKRQYRAIWGLGQQPRTPPI
jgi:hypothetical protein